MRTVKSLTADREGPGTKSVDPKDKDRKDRKPKGQDSKDKGSKDKSPKDRDDEQPIIIVPACVLNQVGSQQAASDQANAANDNESSTVTQANASEIQQALGQSQSGTCNFIINLVAAEEELVNP
ncbi:hypothetical protein ABZ070_13800 [Streptomyces sp. NPDC006283]|uniref:hypothetical protein n=1 Tax=Streptomyces sp. NPDC006283 TaxID=3156741 RepID=UPI0033A02ECD